MLMEKTSGRVRDLIQEAAAAKRANGSVTQKVGDYYTSFMDENAIEAKVWLGLPTKWPESRRSQTKRRCRPILARP